MATLCVIKIAKSLYGAHSEWAVERVAVLICTHAGPKIDGCTRKYTSLEDLLEIAIFVE